MVTTLDLPLPLNILEDICSQQLKTSTLPQLRKSYNDDIAPSKKILKTSEVIFTHKKIGHELCYSCKTSASVLTSETSDFSRNNCLSMKTPPFLPMEKQLSSEDFFMKNYAKK